MFSMVILLEFFVSRETYVVYYNTYFDKNVVDYSIQEIRDGKYCQVFGDKIAVHITNEDFMIRNVLLPGKLFSFKNRTADGV